MKVVIYSLGKIKSAAASQLVEYYRGLCRNTPAVSFELVEIKETRFDKYKHIASGKLQPDKVIAELALPSRNTFLLAEWGREYDTAGLISMLQTKRDAAEDVNFVIGTASGWVRSEGKANGNENGGINFLSLSKLIMNHELAQVVLWEQLYRFCDHLKGGSYTK